jgi:hypothetical protein
MVEEAEKYADEDKATKERIEARNGLENYAFSLKNQVNDEEGLGGKIDEDDKETVSAQIHYNSQDFQLTDISSSKPSRKPLNGSIPTPPPQQPKNSKSKRRSSQVSRTQSRASSMVVLAEREAMMSQVLMTSYK